MRTRLSLFVAVFSMTIAIAACAGTITVLDTQEKNLAVDGINEREFHTALYFPKGEALHYPGYIVAIEKSPRNVVGGPNIENRIADPNAEYIKLEQGKGLAKTTAQIIETYEDKRKSLFLSHIIRYGAPQPGEESSALIDQCFIYNSFESYPAGMTNSSSMIAWRHCGLRPTDGKKSVSVQQPLPAGATGSPIYITSDQYQVAGATNMIYGDGLKALKKLECGLAAHVNKEHFTHLVIIVMGWNTSQDEAIRNFNDIVGNMVEAAEDERYAKKPSGAADADPAAMQFKPLVVGVTWPSYWNKSKWDLASYFDKADDADELGLTWLNVIINKTVPLVLAQPEKDERGVPTATRSLRVILIGHSFGARAAMRALFSGPVLDPPVVNSHGQPKPMVDLAVGLEGAVSVNRFLKPESAEGAPYRDYSAIGTKIVLTASDFDEATSVPVWYKPSGSAKVWRDECKNSAKIFDCWSAADSIAYGKDLSEPTGGFAICPANSTSDCTIHSQFPNESRHEKVLYLNTSDGITKYNTPGTGGGAHSDIYRLPMGRLLWMLTKTYARSGTRQDDLTQPAIDHAQTAAKDCAPKE